MLRSMRRSVVGSAVSAKSGGGRKLDQPTKANMWHDRTLISWLRLSWQGQLSLIKTSSNNPIIPLLIVNPAQNAQVLFNLIDWCSMRCPSVARFTTPGAITAKPLTPPHLKTPAWRYLKVLTVRCEKLISPWRLKIRVGQ
jgi:hypothetical protein